MQTVTHANIPTSLNGFPVKAFTISKDEGRALVLIHRAGDFMPWVAATWFPHCGNEWLWGNYFRSYEGADAYRGHWISTHGQTPTAEAIAAGDPLTQLPNDAPRIKLTGAIGGFQE